MAGDRKENSRNSVVTTAIGTELLFENEAVRVWSMELEPGELSPVHKHESDYLFAYVTDSRIRLIPEDQNEEVEEFDDGFVRFIKVDEPLVHQIQNVSDVPHRQILVEMKTAEGRGSSADNQRRHGPKPS